MATQMQDNVIKNEPEKPVRKKFSWRMLGILVSTLAFIVLLSVTFFSIVHIIAVERQLLDMGVATAKNINLLKIESLKHTKTGEEVNSLKQEITHLKNEISAFTKNQSKEDDWLVLSARYQVKLADSYLRYTYNIPVALQLLQSADNTLAAVKDPKWILVRQALAQDIANLEAIPQVDVDGLFARLLALQNQIPALSFHDSREISHPLPTRHEEKKLSFWQQGLQNTWDTLKKLVVVRYHPNNTLPIVPPEQQNILYQNLYAQVAQAIWALLHGQQDIYLSSLNEMDLYIKTYFVDSDVKRAMIKQIASLKAIYIRQAVPRITALSLFQK